MRATLKQLAERTGLSISTVSRVVTGKGYVSRESRKMVEEAVKALDYVPQERRPVSLKDHDNLVMIMIGGIRSTLCSALLETLVQELEKKHKQPFVAVTSFSPERERAYLRFAAENHFFGVIALAIIDDPQTVEMLRHYPCPVVLVDSFLPALDLDSLCPDYYKMGFVAAEYLIARGHRRIAFIGGLEDSSITQDKKLGFEDCMRSHGLEVPEGGVLYAGIMIYENGGDVARRILKMDPLPTAIVSSNDLSVGILNELSAQGIRVPEDVSLFTCEDSELAAHCHVPLTAVSVELERMSVDSVKTLFRRQRHPNAPRCLYSYNPTLRERSSVAMPREKMA